jgi:hypothetical protein
MFPNSFPQLLLDIHSFITERIKWTYLISEVETMEFISRVFLLSDKIIMKKVMKITFTSAVLTFLI